MPNFSNEVCYGQHDDPRCRDQQTECQNNLWILILVQQYSPATLHLKVVFRVIYKNIDMKKLKNWISWQPQRNLCWLLLAGHDKPFCTRGWGIDLHLGVFLLWSGVAGAEPTISCNIWKLKTSFSSGGF